MVQGHVWPNRETVSDNFGTEYDDGQNAGEQGNWLEIADKRSRDTPWALTTTHRDEMPPPQMTTGLRDGGAYICIPKMG